jgi:radical SAM protein with 4Fe4S-binding SPASM domain
MSCKIIEDKKSKKLISEDFNYLFNKKNGFTAIWGKDIKENPEYCQYGPIIADIELSTICHGGCKFCYKSNASNGKNMTFDTFKIIFDKLPKTLTQIAFGIGDIDGNPDLWKIMEYSRANGVIPNITINSYRMTPRYYDLLTSLCGAVAVSLYSPESCYNAVYELTKRGLKQVNIHAMLSNETILYCISALTSKLTDHRLKELNAIVFLSLKQKGRGTNFNRVNDLKFKALINLALNNGISIGFDSCTAPKFLNAIKDHQDFETLLMMSEACESTLQSCYINSNGVAYPCSFTENTREFSGSNVLECKDFLKDIWLGKEYSYFRNKVLNNKNEMGCRQCPIYEV